MNNAGVLYIVSTPIGNLGDVTFRAVEVLKSVDFIACEDTRRSHVLLGHYGIRKPLWGYQDYSEKKRAPEIIQKIKEGKSVALISDAGTPAVADPGFRLIGEAIRENIRVEVLPGASAVLAALVASGLPTDRFVFEGFLPVKAGERKKRLLSFRDETRTVIFYESPHRLLKTLAEMEETLGNVPMIIARELTKKFEEVFRGSAAEAATHFGSRKVLGEIVVLFNLSVGARSPRPMGGETPPFTAT